MEKSTKIFIAGHKGLVGSAILRRLEKEGFYNLLVRTRDELDLARQVDVEPFSTRKSRTMSLWRRQR